MKNFIKFESLIRKGINSVVLKLGFEVPTYSLNFNQNQDYGDYSSNVAHLIPKNLRESTYDVALKITKELKNSFEEKVFREIKAERNGFINFLISENYLKEIVKTILESNRPFENFFPDEYLYIIEFSSPNMVKPFTIGYLRSTIIGDSISKIFIYCGKKVLRDNHLGDWGVHFGKLLLAIHIWSNMEIIRSSENPYQELLMLYSKFIMEEKNIPKYTMEASYFYKKLEEKNFELFQEWQEIKEILYKGITSIYNRLNINFDTISWESLHVDGARKIIKSLLQKNIAKKSEGAVVIMYENLPPLILEKKDGSTLYGARELACDFDRKNRYGDSLVIINEVGNDQRIYLRQIFETEFLLGMYMQNQRIHLSHGMYQLDGIKMVSEKGNYLYLSDVLDYAKTSILKEFSNVSNDDAEIIAQAAIRFNDLKNPHKSDITFDRDTFTNRSKGTGPYIQYTIHRARSISQRGIENVNNLITFSEPELKIARHLQKFPDNLEFSQKELSCHYIAQYATDLALLYNNYYSNSKILNPNNNNGIILSRCVEKLLCICMELLGIEIPYKI